MSIIDERDVQDHPGWKRLEVTELDLDGIKRTKRQYRSPEGTVVSNNMWSHKVKPRLEAQGYYPEEELRAIALDPFRDFMPSSAPAVSIIDTTMITTPDGVPIIPDDSDEPITQGEYIQPKLNPKLGTRPIPGGFRKAIPHANNYQTPQPVPQPMHRPSPSRATYESEEGDPVARLAAGSKPRPRDGRSSHKRPSAAALSIGIKRLTMLITNVIIFRMLEDERAKLTEQEATALGIALANLLESTKLNEQWGWMIAETGDWQTVGYILVVYFSRIGDIVREKQQSRATNATYNQPSSNPVNQQQQPVDGSYTAGHNGASLRMNVSSTPIVHPPQ